MAIESRNKRFFTFFSFAPERLMAHFPGAAPAIVWFPYKPRRDRCGRVFLWRLRIDSFDARSRVAFLFAKSTHTSTRQWQASSTAGENAFRFIHVRREHRRGESHASDSVRRPHGSAACRAVPHTGTPSIPRPVAEHESPEGVAFARQVLQRWPTGMQIVQFSTLMLLFGVVLARRIVFGFAVIPVLERHGIRVRAPYHPWRMNAALMDYRRICIENGESLRWWRRVCVLDAIGLAAVAMLLATVVL
jgi:hypothetical protein